ncbi:putative tail protein [Vibrio phage 1.017.O._10N.286.55.C11]|nr:putative tail protein [Vibrio phage 1.017.O._10N.286.55.C11]AUR85451.1 putative tail protein [Vibrio phage 1.075.O._10N.286.55.B10]AUR86997.1 putative tail protein [Vibrio phage 1.093.O._10N.286.55.E10]AUR87070.1 putative tail protein [Vibrio phage 1.094.O._10N.286.55.E12]AUR96473.1 putative tail protein [Vibrio phage 1.225.O._10N.261.48.B7]
MTKKISIPQEAAEAELITLLDAMDIDTDVDSMLEDDAKDFKDKLRTLAKPIMTGRAIVDGDSYVLTLKKPISDDEKTITITEPGGTAWEMMDKGGKNQDMKKLMMFIAGMVGVPYVQINRLPNSDLKILKEFALLFLA